ncbi:Non-specific serine/threonine protein kinase protein [Dioscorea alata]|uniref:Non-specific serine/threonine protein kinase protein n=1 Tax=Dioscorea alata TaxID=55571 RepID=A0ACB7UCV2_DIOAL|nr:Non-specific serine/threonine protein kinase protein [Dioscorea alata]
MQFDRTPSKTMNLIERLNIAIDVASALDYLHNYGHKPIIHCDLKPSNVLLDNDMCAHVADFGLAKFLSEMAPQSFECSTSSFDIKGSIGYIAPEYGSGGQVSTYGDVYSYGILLLEMFTSKRPTDDSLKEGIGLHMFVSMAFPDRLLDAVDPFLLYKANDEEAKEISVEEQNCFVSVFRVGLCCSKESPKERMEMGDVTEELHAIKDSLMRFEIDGRFEEK